MQSRVAKDDQAQKVVGHLVSDYLFLTGSWIYHQLTNLGSFRPIVLTNSTENLDVFPFHPIYSYGRLSPAQKVWFRLRSGDFDDVYYSYFCATLKRNGASLLHSHFGYAGVTGLELKRTLGIPMVTTFYGADMSLAWQETHDLYQPLFEQGDLFLVEGHYMRKCLVELGCPPEKVVVQHIGVDLAQLPCKPRCLTKGEKLKVLVAASFREKKGIPYAIQAFAKVHVDLPHTELRIIGNGPLRDEIVALVDELGLHESVRFMGYQPYPVFCQQLLDCHVFLAPSVTASDGDTEGGSPVAITEAQATGMPVVSTYHADIPEVVLDGETGLLAEERDVDGLAEKLEHLAAHPYLWTDFGEKARRYIEHEYDVKKQVRKLENLYQACIG